MAKVKLNFIVAKFKSARQAKDALKRVTENFLIDDVQSTTLSYRDGSTVYFSRTIVSASAIEDFLQHQCGGVLL